MSPQWNPVFRPIARPAKNRERASGFDVSTSTDPALERDRSSSGKTGMLQFIKWLTALAIFFVCIEPGFTQAGPVDPFPFTEGSDEGFPATGNAPDFPLKSGESCNRIDFDNYQLVSGIAKNAWLLLVWRKMRSR